MRAVLIIGVIVLVLGILSFFVGIPHKDKAGVSIGGAEVGVETRSNQRIPVAGSVALVVGGIVLIAVGAKSGR
jgi:hypothetical protein